MLPITDYQSKYARAHKLSSICYCDAGVNSGSINADSAVLGMLKCFFYNAHRFFLIINNNVSLK